jgi:hypothetical protein
MVLLVALHAEKSCKHVLNAVVEAILILHERADDGYIQVPLHRINSKKRGTEQIYPLAWEFIISSGYPKGRGRTLRYRIRLRTMTDLGVWKLQELSFFRLHRRAPRISFKRTKAALPAASEIDVMKT